MASTHTLLLLRHAQAQDLSPGLRDHERPLTDYGIEQAESVGDALRSHSIHIDHVICSSAVRTRQTWSALGIDAEMDLSDEAYNAGSETLLGLIRRLGEDIGSALVIGHGPGLPTLAADLAGPGSDQHATNSVNTHYPPATLALYEVDARWNELQTARLVWLRLGQ